MKKNLSILILFIVLAIILIWIPNLSDSSDSSNTPLTTTGLPVQPTSADSSASIVDSLFWIEQRNERFGFGIATPCWWEVTPMPAEGVISSMTVRNFDEAFFLANSDKGAWLGGIPPKDVVSIDITVATDIDLTQTLAKSFLQLVDTNTYSINNAIDRTIGNNTFTIVVLENVNNPSEPNSVIYLTSLEPNALVIFSATPPQAIQSNDVQAILSSFAASADELVKFPQVAPEEPLINKPCDL